MSRTGRGQPDAPGLSGALPALRLTPSTARPQSPDPEGHGTQTDTLAALRRIAKAAGRAIMTVYRAGPATPRQKADNSPVTEADLRADALIQEELGRLFPDIPIWSEESEPAPSADTHRRFFLVDPLDGTKEFLQRNGEFTVNIAWVVDGVSRLGVVHAPALGLTWWGGSGLGAWRERVEGATGLGAADTPPAPTDLAEGEVEMLQVRPGPNTDVLRVLASRSHADGRLQGWLERLGSAVDVVHAGSSLKFCRIAEGRADLYPRFGPTSQWDTAAGQAVLEGAGGVVTGLDGRPLRYGRQHPVINPDFVAARALSLWHRSAPATSRPRS